MTENSNLPAKSRSFDERKIAHIAYLLYAVGVVIGLTSIAGVILAHMKVGESEGVIESHYRWLIRTFWFALAGFVVAMLLTILWIGWILWLVVAVWYIYRVVKGWLRLNDGRGIDDPAALI